MSEKKPFTPLPWARSTQETGRGERILWTEATNKGSYRYVGYIHDNSDAEFIVHCVNTFEEREALIKELFTALRHSNELLDAYGSITPDSETKATVMGVCNRNISLLSKYKSNLG